VIDIRAFKLVSARFSSVYGFYCIGSASGAIFEYYHCFLSFGECSSLPYQI